MTRQLKYDELAIQKIHKIKTEGFKNIKEVTKEELWATLHYLSNYIQPDLLSFNENRHKQAYEKLLKLEKFIENNPHVIKQLKDLFENKIYCCKTAFKIIGFDPKLD